jgi:hypothetical protein
VLISSDPVEAVPMESFTLSKSVISHMQII